MAKRLAALSWLALCAAPLSACAGGMRVDAPGLHDGGDVPLALVYDALGCRGGNHSPALHWDGAPAQARSFAVTMYDPDAGGHGWWHWVLYDLPASTHALPADAGHAPPAGARQARNDFGTPGYGGPCPPPGAAHRYEIVVHALRDARLPVSADADAAAVAAAIRASEIARARIVLRYAR